MAGSAKITPMATNQDLTLESNGTGMIHCNRVSFVDNKISTVYTNDDLQLDPNGTGVLDFLSATQSTVGSAGGGSALPGAPTGYLKIKIAGTLRVIPFWDQA